MGQPIITLADSLVKAMISTDAAHPGWIITGGNLNEDNEMPVPGYRDQQEIDHDLNGERSNVVTDSSVNSIFDCADDVEDLPFEMPKKPYKVYIIGGKEISRVTTK